MQLNVLTQGALRLTMFDRPNHTGAPAASTHLWDLNAQLTDFHPFFSTRKGLSFGLLLQGRIRFNEDCDPHLYANRVTSTTQTRQVTYHITTNLLVHSVHLSQLSLPLTLTHTHALPHSYSFSTPMTLNALVDLTIYFNNTDTF